MYYWQHPIFTAALFIIAKIWTQPQCSSVGEWIKKLWLHLRNGIVHCREKEGNLTFCYSTNGRGGY